MTKRLLTTQKIVNLSSDPSSGVSGEIYYNTTSNKLRFYNGTAWADTSTTGGGSSITVNDAVPSSPSQGDLWFESDTGRTFIYYDSYWVEIGSQQTAPTLQLTGDVTGNGSSNIATTLANSGVAAGVYGSSSLIPIITVDGKGRVTNVSTTAPSASGVASISFGSTGLTPATATTGTVTVAGILAIANGGTGTTTSTGTGKLVLDNTPTLITPIIGVATATSINKITITAPTTSATLTLADGSVLATSGAFSTTLTATATTNVTLPTSGTLATTNDVNRVTRNLQNASYIPTSSDVGKIIEMNVSTANTVTMNVSGFSDGDTIDIIQYGTGKTQIVAGTATLKSSGGALYLTSQYSSASLYFRSATNEWIVIGDLSTS